MVTAHALAYNEMLEFYVRCVYQWFYGINNFFFNSDKIFSVKMLGKDNFLMRRVVQTIKCNTTRLVSCFIDQGYQLFVTSTVIIYEYYNFFGI